MAGAVTPRTAGAAPSRESYGDTPLPGADHLAARAVLRAEGVDVQTVARRPAEAHDHLDLRARNRNQRHSLTRSAAMAGAVAPGTRRRVETRYAWINCASSAEAGASSVVSLSDSSNAGAAVVVTVTA